MIDVHYASLASRRVQHRVFHLDGHPSRYQPRPTGLNFNEETGTGVFGDSRTSVKASAYSRLLKVVFTSMVKLLDLKNFPNFKVALAHLSNPNSEEIQGLCRFLQTLPGRPCGEGD